jgi:hypothetical protein
MKKTIRELRTPGLCLGGAFVLAAVLDSWPEGWTATAVVVVFAMALLVVKSIFCVFFSIFADEKDTGET